MKYITKEVRIGIAGIAALCILVYGIRMSTDLPSLVLSLPTVFV